MGIQTALNDEMTEHLGYEKHDPVRRESGNIRDGTRGKTVLTDSVGLLTYPRLMCQSFC